MRKSYILRALVIILVILGSSSLLYAIDAKDRSEEILSLIEEGAIELDNQRYMHALQKYKEVMTIVEDTLAREPQNKRISLLKELLENKVAECRREIDKIEEELDKNFTYKKELENAYILIEKADEDIRNSKFYVALKKYNEAKGKLESALENVPGWHEPRLLLELVERRIASAREEIDKLSGITERERLFLKRLEEIMDIVEKSSGDEEDQKFLLALQGYIRALDLATELEKDYPEKARVSLTKDMINIRFEGCREKIKRLERAIEERLFAVPPKKIPTPPKKVIEKIPPREEVVEEEKAVEEILPVEKVAEEEKAVEEILPVEKVAEEEKAVEEIVIEKPKAALPSKRPPLKIPSVKMPEMPPRIPRVRIPKVRMPRVRIPKLKIAPVKTYLKTRFENIKNFISLSRKEGEEISREADYINYKRRARLKEGLKSSLNTLHKEFIKAKVSIASYFKRPPSLPEIVEEKKKELVEKTAAVKVSVVEKMPIVEKAVRKPVIFPEVRSLEGYSFATDIEVIIDDEKAELTKILIKDNDLWVNIKELADVLGTTLIHKKGKNYVIIRTDGIPLGFEIGKKELTIRDSPFYTLDRLILSFEGEPYVGFDGLGVLFNVEVDWRPSEKTLILTRPHKREELFTAFTKPKPKELLEKERAEREVPPEIPKEEIFKEKRLVPYIPSEVLPDINMRVNNNMTYLYNNDPQNRTRTRSEYLTVAGKTPNYTFNSQFEWRDERTGHLVNRSKFIGVYGEDTWFKFLDLYHDLAPLRSQSEGYEGFEVSKFYVPYATRIWGGRKEISVAGPSGVGSVKYFGKLAGIQQLYDSDFIDLRGEVIGMVNEAETHQKKGRTDFPRRNLVYMTDARLHLPAKFDLSGQYAVSNYNPDNLKDELIQDVNWKIEGIWDRMEENNFLVRGDYEFLGTDYASLGIPSSYRDYKGLSVQTRYKPTKFLYLNTVYKQSQNNVDDVDSQPTTQSNYISSNIGYYFPTDTSLNLSWARNYAQTTGPGETYVELQGSLSNSYRVDLSQNWRDLNLYLSYERYHLDAKGSDTDSWSDTYSASLYKFLPAHRGSYIRLRHELRKAWFMASGSHTTITNDTDLGWRYYFTKDIYVYNDWFLRLTETEAYQDTAYISTRAGAYWHLDEDLSLGVDFNFDQRNLNNPSPKDWNEWSVLFKCNWGFEYNSPYKWAKVNGYVFRDLNANGIMDEEDEGIENVLIIIPNENMARTDKKGSYYMREVIPGDKTVKLDTKTLPMELSVLYDNIADVTIRERQREMVNFPLIMLSSLYGRVFIDENEDGVLDAGEEGLEDIDIILFPEGRWTRTDENGRFSFEFVKPGQWEIIVNADQIPTQYKLVSDEKIRVSLGQGEEIEGLYFIVRPKPIVKKVF